MKKLIRKILWSIGYDVQAVENSGSMSRLLYDTIIYSKPNYFLDVGANIGQSALEVIRYRPDCKIASFEPLSEAHAIASKASEAFPLWTVYPRMALGETEGEVSIHISDNSVSSSLLPMKALHVESAPGSACTREEKTKVKRLDQVLEDHSPTNRYYLKVDTQGFEMNVLKGAVGILDQVVAIQVELSWEELYAGQPLAIEVISWLLANGFRPYGFAHVFRNANTKCLLQMDGYFLRAK
jgi:FkbM family methyltransferase